MKPSFIRPTFVSCLALFLGVTSVVAYAIFTAPPLPIPLYPSAYDIESYTGLDNPGFFYYFTTSDSPDQVLDFYDANLPADGLYFGIPSMETPSDPWPVRTMTYYKGTDCWTWFHYSATGSGIHKSSGHLRTFRGEYAIEVTVLPTSEYSGGNTPLYVRVRVSESHETRVSCGGEFG